MASRISSVVAPILAFAAFMGLSQPAEAQGTFSVTPWIGFVVPAGDIGEFTDGDATLTIKDKSGIGFGGMLSYDAAGSRWGFDFGVGYSTGDVEAEFCETGLGCETDEESGNVMTLSARARYTFSPAEARTKFYGAFGVAYLIRGGDAWDTTVLGAEFDGKNDIGGSLAVGVRHPLSDMMDLVVEVEDVIFPGELDADFGAGIESNSNINNRFTIRGGLRFAFGG
jgi:hypothetical protein